MQDSASLDDLAEWDHPTPEEVARQAVEFDRFEAERDARFRTLEEYEKEREGVSATTRSGPPVRTIQEYIEDSAWGGVNVPGRPGVRLDLGAGPSNRAIQLEESRWLAPGENLPKGVWGRRGGARSGAGTDRGRQ